jgi:hypothetical protein
LVAQPNEPKLLINLLSSPGQRLSSDNPSECQTYNSGREYPFMINGAHVVVYSKDAEPIALFFATSWDSRLWTPVTDG